MGLVCFVLSDPAQFEEFKRNFDRKYSSQSEELQRYEIFRTNLAKINAHNSRKGKNEQDKIFKAPLLSNAKLFRRDLEDGCEPVY